MKKPLIILSIIVCILAVLGGAIYLYGPSMLYKAVGKAIGSNIDVASTKITYQNGTIVFTLSGITLKGNMDGKIESCEIRLLPKKVFFVKGLKLSGFDVAAKKQESKIVFFPIPIEHAVFTNGTLRYGGQKYIIREFTVSNFNTGKKLEFTIDGAIEGFGKIKSRGEGIFGQTHSDIKGEYRISQFDIGKVLENYEGLTDSEGLFSFKDGTITFEGDAWAPYFSIYEKFLTKRLGDANQRAHLKITRTGEITEAIITGVTFENAPITLKVRSRQMTMLFLEMTMDYVPIPRILETVDMAQLADEEWGPFSYVTDGEVRIGKLTYNRGLPLTASVDIRNASAGTSDIVFSKVNGSLTVDGQIVTLSGFDGVFHNSRLYDISGVVPLTRARNVEVSGKYRVSLEDIEKYYRTDLVNKISGVTTGEFEVQGMLDQGFKVAGAGTLNKGDFEWKAIHFTATGPYSFNSDSLSFNGLQLKGDGTDIEADGTLTKLISHFSVSGIVEGRHIMPFLPQGYTVSGPIGVNSDIDLTNKGFSGKGQAVLTDIEAHIPGLVRKPRGIESTMRVTASGTSDGEFDFDEFHVTFGPITADIMGSIDSTGIRKARVLLDAPNLEKVSPFFSLAGVKLEGNGKADFTVQDLHFPIEKLPRIEGELTFHNGFVNLPTLTYPFVDINIHCRFNGDTFIAETTGAKSGRTILDKGRIEITGLVAPIFSMTADFLTLDPGDFQKKLSEPFTIPTIEKDSILGRTKGEFQLSATQFVFGDSVGNHVAITGELKDRKITIKEGNIAIGAGNAHIEGTADLSGVPAIAVVIDTKDITAKDALTLAGAETDLIEGTGTIKANLHFEGANRKQLLAHAKGMASIDSAYGVIKKWSLLSKILALINIYDLVQGKVDFSKDGLIYKKMTATFEVKDGLFHTGDFLINSPSMTITGRGDIDLPGKSIEGKMLVSPLVSLDKVIAWIPLVNRIFREKKAGFLYFVFNINGSLSDPKITTTYVEGMGRRLFSILWNTIRLPKDVLDLLPKEESYVP
jgi:hypothetical protein